LLLSLFKNIVGGTVTISGTVRGDAVIFPAGAFLIYLTGKKEKVKTEEIQA